MTLTDSDIEIRKTYGLSLGGDDQATVTLSYTTDESQFDEYNHNLFSKIEPDDIDNARATYRCLAIYNNGSETWENAKAWIVWSGGVQSAVTISLGKEDISGGKVSQIASEYEAPSATFYSPTTKDDADVIDLGDISASSWTGLWIKRNVTTSAESRSNERVQIRVEGDDTSGSSSYVGKTFQLFWDTITTEVWEVLERLNGIPYRRVNLRGIQESYDDTSYLVNQLVGSGATTAQINRVCQARAMYYAYQQYTVEIEKAGQALTPQMVSRVYELRRNANEMMNSIAKTSQRPEAIAMKGRSWRGRVKSWRY